MEPNPPYGGQEGAQTLGPAGQHVLTMHFQPDGHSLLEEHVSAGHCPLKSAQKPLPSMVWAQEQFRLLSQANLASKGPQLKAQLHSPCSRGVPPLLRHLRCWLRVRASAESAKPMLESVAPSTL